MKLRLRSALSAALILGSVAGPVAAAEPATTSTPSPAASTSDNRAVAEMLFFTARGLMEAGRFPEACAKLGESYRLDAASGTLLNLAVCHEQEGRIASAWGEFRQALSDARKANRADREELAKEHIGKIEGDLPFLTIQVPDNVKVKELEILRNGVALQAGGWGTELPIDPGKVEITARAPGYLPRTKTIMIQKRQHLSTTVEKLDLAPVVETAVVDPGWTTKRKIGTAIFLGGLVSAGVGTYFGLSALDNMEKSNANCPTLDAELRCNNDGASFSTKANTAAWGTNIAVGLGAAGVLVGSYLFLSGGRSHATETAAAEKVQQARAPSIRFGASPTVGGAQGVVFGSF